MEAETKTELLRAVARCLPELVFVLDEDGRYVDVIGGSNRQLYDDAAGLVGRRLHDVLARELAERFLGSIRDALEKNCTIKAEYSLATTDVDNPGSDKGPGGRQWFEASIAPLDMEMDGRRLVSWTAYNATERHELLVRLEAQAEQLERQKEELEQLALEDHLTGLSNRRHFETIMEHEFRKARSVRMTSLSLILLDMDHFKSINDTYGHAAGDAALKATAGMLTSTVRVSDVVSRVGGEEFALLLPGSSIRDSERVAENLLARIAASPVYFGDEPIICTASIGIAAHRPEDDDWQALFRRADRALYEAKREGRNRFRVAPAA